MNPQTPEVKALIEYEWTESDYRLADQCRAIAGCDCKGKEMCDHCFNAGIRLDG